MVQSKHEYFHLGVNNQKTPDIVIDLRRVDRKKMKQWTPEQRRGLLDFMKTCEEAFETFKGEILEANELLNSEQEVKASVASKAAQ
jgi:hypothetical protein